MQTLTELVANTDLRDRVFSDRQLAGIVEGSAQRRYNLVNRALQAGEMVRLARGLYMLDPAVSGVRPHSFAVAQALRPGSFVSFESALAWHGRIPEAVRQVRCVVPGRRKARFDMHSYGEFRFFPMPVKRGFLLAGVKREPLPTGIALVATPLRALLDLCCFHKIEAEALPEFLGGLRLDDDWVTSLATDDVLRYLGVYRFRRMERLIDCLAGGLVT